MTRPLRILFASSEVAGFAKTGGLADVAAALPRALAERGHDVAVVMPRYRACHSQPAELLPQPLRASMGNKLVEGRLWRSRLPGTDVPVYLIDLPRYFDRDDPKYGAGIYQFAGPDGQRSDYSDNCERFTFFSRAVLELVAALDLHPDVIHANDWQTGLVPVFLRENYARMGRPAVRERYERIRTAFTIHNLAYQGAFDKGNWGHLGLPWSLFQPEKLEFYDRINLLKGGLVYADALTAVSPTYAREIQTAYYGCGLQGVLMGRSRSLVGIVNGIDERVWNPAIDAHLAMRYDVATAATGKRACKRALQERMGLAVDASAPLFGVVSRLALQKGLNLVAEVAARYVAQGCQFALLGAGDRDLEAKFAKLRDAHPGQVALAATLDEALAHQIEAGADAFLMPSQYEPCGLNQLYSLAYGTIPIVRATGGLADTVVDATPENLAAGRATGFSFLSMDTDGLREAIDRALAIYRREPQTWRRIQETGMRQDWSWSRSAGEYEALYRRLVRGDA